MAKFNINDFAFGGIYHDYFFNLEYNLLATLQNCLANCTCLTIGLCYVMKKPLVIKGAIPSASLWDSYYNKDDYRLIKFDKSKLKVGDVIQWKKNCHVCTIADIVGDQVYVHSSWYTGEHGKSKYNGKYDTRTSFKSMKDWADWCINNYAYRYYHYVTLEEECNGIGGQPEYIISLMNNIKPVEENKSVNQIKVNTNEQNIRDDNNNIVGVAQKGYYNVLSQKESNGYIWNEVADGCYIASGDKVGDRVVYIPKEEMDYQKLYIQAMQLNNELKERLNKINELSEV